MELKSKILNREVAELKSKYCSENQKSNIFRLRLLVKCYMKSKSVKSIKFRISIWRILKLEKQITLDKETNKNQSYCQFHMQKQLQFGTEN